MGDRRHLRILLTSILRKGNYCVSYIAKANEITIRAYTTIHSVSKQGIWIFDQEYQTIVIEVGEMKQDSPSYQAILNYYKRVAHLQFNLIRKKQTYILLRLIHFHLSKVKRILTMAVFRDESKWEKKKRKKMTLANIIKVKMIDTSNMAAGSLEDLVNNIELPFL